MCNAHNALACRSATFEESCRERATGYSLYGSGTRKMVLRRMVPKGKSPNWSIFEVEMAYCLWETHQERVGGVVPHLSRCVSRTQEAASTLQMGFPEAVGNFDTNNRPVRALIVRYNLAQHHFTGTRTGLRTVVL